MISPDNSKGANMIETPYLNPNGTTPKELLKQQWT